MSGHELHPLVKQLLDGDITLADLPPSCAPRANGAASARRRGSHGRLDAASLACHGEAGRPASPFPAWLLAPASRSCGARHLARATDARARLACHGPLCSGGSRREAGEPCGYVQPVGSAGDAAGRAGATGVWTATLTLPAGQHQYAFVVDGARWVPDPGAPAIDDGFGRRNSVLTL